MDLSELQKLIDTGASSRVPSLYEGLQLSSPTYQYYDKEQYENFSEGKTISSSMRGFKPFTWSEPGYQVRAVFDAPLEIRILSVLPASSFLDDIECELKVVRLDQAPPYEALSYTWGDPSLQRLIAVNERQMHVTNNLWCALRYLRQETGVRSLWVDAICINQNDLTEKSFMVAHMHFIYSAAEKVIAWVGEATPKSDQAIAFLKGRMNEALPLDLLTTLLSKSDTTGIRPLENIDISIWVALLDLFGRPWWTRAWIVQEICASRQWILMCGENHINGNDFSRILLNLHKAVERAVEIPYQVKLILTVPFYFPEHQLMLNAKHLLTLLCTYQNSKAQDDRDKIFAFTNMIVPPIPELRPNYNEQTAEIYYQAALQIIKIEGDLRILSLCEPQDPHTLKNLVNIDGLARNHIESLPSWIPNWTIPRMSRPLWGYLDVPCIPFAAAGNIPMAAEFHGKTLTESKGILTVRGLLINVVKSVSHDPNKQLVAPYSEGMINLINEGPISGPPGEDQITMVNRTLTLDRDYTGQKLYEQIADDDAEIKRSTEMAMVGRRVLFRTEEKLIGVGPYGVRVGDFVAIIPGCHVPIILRRGLYKNGTSKGPCGDHDELDTCVSLGCAQSILFVKEGFKVCGEAYVHGVMNGELSHLLAAENLPDLELRGTDDEVTNLDAVKKTGQSSRACSDR